MREWKTKYLCEPVPVNEKEYVWYKLLVFYHAQTEKFDRGLTELRSIYDPTEAFIVLDEHRNRSNRYAFDMRQFINDMADGLGIPMDMRCMTSSKYHFSAQRWIDEYDRLSENGEMDFIHDFMNRG